MNFRSALLALALVAPASAQVAPSPSLAGIAHVALRVADLEKARDFYGKLGFTDAFDLSHDGKVYESFIKINDRQFIELYPTSGKDPDPGFLHICFESKDLAANNAYYVAEGLTPTPVIKAGAGNLLFTMKGPLTPTGPQNMEYTQYQPGSRHTNDFGKHLGADRIATEIIAVSIAVEDVPAAKQFYRSKIAFVGKGDKLFFPNDAHRWLEFTDAAKQGTHAVFTLRPEGTFSDKTLKARGIPFDHHGRVLSMTDPDGNTIQLLTR